jgi:Rrf2 family transcriptional regulator, iron-sulfur cluster assembly transcription factor
MLTQAVGYAATALGFVAASNGRAVLVKEIAEACDIPGPYLAKIINGLSRQGVVFTQRGIGGGVTLSKPANQISLFDLCVALTDPIVQKRCMLGTAECSDERACPAHMFWTGHRAQQVEFLKRTTLADIANFETKHRWENVLGQMAAASKAAAPKGPSHEDLAHAQTNGNGHALRNGQRGKEAGLIAAY